LNKLLRIREAEEILVEIGGNHVSRVADTMVVLLAPEDFRESPQQVQFFHASMLTEMPRKLTGGRVSAE
ncbi:MAG: hypothetical protein QOE82_1274, partial [Thermoanaerobaculia bacterium]|nr:hypothetical protein [Thermoanaerobaculia bacterium]